MSLSSPKSFDDLLSTALGIVIGLVLIGSGFWVRSINAHQRATLTETRGTVVDSVSRRDRSSTDGQAQATYAPVIEFLVNGDRVRFTGKYESYRLSRGHVVVVRYDPEQPTTTAQTVEPLEDLVPWSLWGMGGMSLFFSLGALLPWLTWFVRK